MHSPGAQPCSLRWWHRAPVAALIVLPCCCVGVAGVLATLVSPGASREFGDLIGRLLEKNPAQRISWKVRAPCAALRVLGEFAAAPVREALATALPPDARRYACWRLPQELVVHPFWQVQLQWLDMPPEPQLELFIRQNNLAPASMDPRASMAAVSAVRTRLGGWVGRGAARRELQGA